MRYLNIWLCLGILAHLSLFPSLGHSKVKEDKFQPQFTKAAINTLSFNTEGLTLDYVKGEIFDTCIVNGEQFALIDDRAFQALTSRSDENILLSLPDHHLIMMDPVSASTLTLEGKSVTIVTSMTISKDLTIDAKAGNFVAYGAGIDVGGKFKVIGNDVYFVKSRIETIPIEKNGRVRNKRVDYRAIINNFFHEGVKIRSSNSIALGLLQTGSEVLLSKKPEFSRSEILNLWNVP